MIRKLNRKESFRAKGMEMGFIQNKESKKFKENRKERSRKARSRKTVFFRSRNIRTPLFSYIENASFARLGNRIRECGLSCVEMITGKESFVVCRVVCM